MYFFPKLKVKILPFSLLTVSKQQTTRDFILLSYELLLTCWTKPLLLWPQCLDKLISKKVSIIWQIDNWATVKFKTPYQNILRTDWFQEWLSQLTIRIKLWSLLLLSKKLFYKFYGYLQFFFFEKVFVYILSLLSLLFKFFSKVLSTFNKFIKNACYCLRCLVVYILTSVWLCMSVVFVVAIQWPTGTDMTSPYKFIA